MASSEVPETPEQQEQEQELSMIDVHVITPTGTKVNLGEVSISVDVGYIKSSLLELVETGAYTNYRLVDTSSGDDWNEYNEVAKYMPAPGEAPVTLVNGAFKVELRMVQATYDVKLARRHVKRLRELLQFPPAYASSNVVEQCGHLAPLSSTPVQAAQSNNNKNNNNNNKNNNNEGEKEEGVKLSDFYETALYQLCPDPHVVACDVPLTSGRDVVIAKSAARGGVVEAGSALRAALQDVSISGYNPPPPHRALVGDLCYLEVRALDQPGAPISFHVTATTEGFYVNGSSRSNFDPTPQDDAHFSPVLLNTVLSRATTARKVYASYVRAVMTSVAETKAMQAEGVTAAESTNPDNMSTAEVVAAATREAERMDDTMDKALAAVGFHMRTGCGKRVQLHPHWLQLPHDDITARNGASGGGGSGNYKDHSWDVSRAQEDLADALGNEDHTAAPREWNEQYQTILALKPPTVEDGGHSQIALYKRRYLARILLEFKECCTKSAKAVVDGLLPPLNPMDEQGNHVYMYNNTYFSFTVDTEEQSKVCYPSKCVTIPSVSITLSLTLPTTHRPRSY